MQDAQRHDQIAHEHVRAAAAADNTIEAERYQCGDEVPSEQVTTGGERVSTWQPCFALVDETAERHREAAEYERELARKDRAAAARLLETQRFACAGIPEREIGHSPFSHESAIEKIAPIYNGDRLAGVRVEFEAVRGLTADWLRRAIECQRARWAVMGKDAAWMPMDPTLIDGAKIDVRARDGRIVVLVTTYEPKQAALALSRARNQLGQTARR